MQEEEKGKEENEWKRGETLVEGLDVREAGGLKGRERGVKLRHGVKAEEEGRYQGY